MAKYYTLDITEGRFTFTRNQAPIAAEAALDGIYVVRTGVPARDIAARPRRRHWAVRLNNPRTPGALGTTTLHVVRSVGHRRSLQAQVNLVHNYPPRGYMT